MRQSENENFANVPIVYMVVTNDRFELPLGVFDSSGELTKWLGMSSNTRSASQLSRTSDGIVLTKDRRYKYLRLNPQTGEIYVGKLPSEVTGFCLSSGHKHRGRKTSCGVVAERDGEELYFLSVREAAEKTGCNLNSIYSSIRSGYRINGYVWRYSQGG